MQKVREKEHNKDAAREVENDEKRQQRPVYIFAETLYKTVRSSASRSMKRISALPNQLIHILFVISA